MKKLFAALVLCAVSAGYAAAYTFQPATLPKADPYDVPGPYKEVVPPQPVEVEQPTELSTILPKVDPMSVPAPYRECVTKPTFAVLPKAMKTTLPKELWLAPNAEDSLKIAFDGARHTMDYNKILGVKSGHVCNGENSLSPATFAVVLFPSRECFMQYPGQRQMEDLRKAGIKPGTPVTAAAAQAVVKMGVMLGSAQFAENNVIMDTKKVEAVWGEASLSATVQIDGATQQLVVKRLTANLYIVKMTVNGKTSYAYFK